jgi:hypothetical protein
VGMQRERSEGERLIDGLLGVGKGRERGERGEAGTG